jgi:hypothetical protein
VWRALASFSRSVKKQQRKQQYENERMFANPVGTGIAAALCPWQAIAERRSASSHSISMKHFPPARRRHF